MTRKLASNDKTLENIQTSVEDVNRGILASTRNIRVHKQLEDQARRYNTNTGSQGRDDDRSLEYGNKVERINKGLIASDCRL